MAVKLKANTAGSELAVINRKLTDLKVYENNPRKNDSEVPKMVELIKKFGFKVPILVRGDRIVDGHLRMKAATALGMETVPTIDIGKMSDAEERALRIAINKSVEWSKWDEDALGVEMKAIAEAGLDLNFTGFGSTEISGIMKKLVEEPPMKDPSGPITKTKQADAGAPADPDYVSITFHMSAPNRDKVMAALAKYQAENGLNSPTQSLLHLLLG